MRLAEIYFTLSLTIVLPTASIRVFSFNSTDDHNEPSSAVLVRGPTLPLPERFIVCFSVKHDKINGRSPLLIRDKNNQPWIALSIWPKYPMEPGGQIGLWVEVGKSVWKMFRKLSTPWKFWSHICADINSATGNISLAMDGLPPVTKHFEKLKKGKPINIDQKLEIGLSDTDKTLGGRRSSGGRFQTFTSMCLMKPYFYKHSPKILVKKVVAISPGQT